ncbi:Uncharacterized protein HZ326_19158 [Fusarium oxysporum f. sp. albedinis]|nr:Uncharacterized protein HZ326_19712 [Fusarium oxysporum f. sp. albedinis]KAJ0137885.1 Uncharacterized protein HZ326_19158 [Fusarium oxysporum f. sp. albedinis]
MSLLRFDRRSESQFEPGSFSWTRFPCFGFKFIPPLMNEFLHCEFEEIRDVARFGNSSNSAIFVRRLFQDNPIHSIPSEIERIK